MRKLPVSALYVAMLALSGCSYREVVQGEKCTKVTALKTYEPYFVGILPLVPKHYAILEDGKAIEVGPDFKENSICELVWQEVQELNLNKRPP